LNSNDFLKDIVNGVNHTHLAFWDFTKPREQAYFLLKCVLDNKAEDPVISWTYSSLIQNKINDKKINVGIKSYVYR
jgi:hypothetical protein